MNRTFRHFYLLSVNPLLLFVAVVCFFACAATSVWGQSITVHPQDGMMDVRLAVSIGNLAPRQPVIIRAAMQDGDGKLWQSYAGFYADPRGTVDLAAQAPVNGTYTGVDPMGLIHSMNLPGNDYKRVRFRTRRADPLILKLSVEVDGQNVASTEITRRFMRPTGRMIDVRNDGLVGTLFTPAGEGPFHGIIVLGGSEGGVNSEHEAALLSSRGYAALALAYFGAEGLPDSLEEIPVEYFKKAIDWLMSQRYVRDGGVALLGTSKGAEAALLVGTHYTEVRAVVGYVPSGVVWSCICGAPDRSSWSFSGASVPFVPQGTDPTYRPPQGFPIKPAINYAYRLKNLGAVQRAIIPVERINGPVLLISGKDDQLWPSRDLAELVMDRLKKDKRQFANQHLTYESAGHLIGKAYLPVGTNVIAGGRLSTGGTLEGNAQAEEDAWPKVLKFLEAAFSRRMR